MPNVAKFIPVSLIDYPGHIATTVFMSGCNLRCRYCHNPELVTGRRLTDVYEEFAETLKNSDIEGVAVSGGEPLFSGSLKDFLRELKENNLLVKLDTNGCFPARLQDVCSEGLVDFVSVDLKAFSDDDLSYITRTDMKMSQFFRTLDVLNSCGVRYDIRHTLWKVPDIDSVRSVMEMIGDKELILQFPVKSGKWLDKRFSINFSREDQQEISDIFDIYNVRYRNLLD